MSAHQPADVTVQVPVAEVESTLSCGRDLHAVDDLAAQLNLIQDDGFVFAVIPLVHPRFERPADGDARSGLFTRSDRVLSTKQWSRYVVGKVSDWVIHDLIIDSRRKAAEKAIIQELSWAAHLSLPAIQLSVFGMDSAVAVAASLNTVIQSTHNNVYWIHVPLVSPKASAEEVQNGTDGRPLEDPWEWWITLRQLCVPTARLCVALELTADLPTGDEILRWMGEPVKMIIVPCNVFLRNKKGFPVLGKAHQLVVKQLMKFDPQFALKGNSGEVGDRRFLKYLEHMDATKPEPNAVAKFATGYEDYLQAPLQPLMDNLESQTYEVFEKDPFKYAEYQRAVHAALLDRVPEGVRKITTTTIMVVGAGRGPLVQCSLEAARLAQCRVKVFAIEKNPNAVVTLEARNADEWGGKVTVVSTDMREWDTDVKADIMVSELLGSFADNELSPECLDGAQKFLAKDGVSIPQNSTSFLAPVATSKLHTELVLTKEKKQLETPYVVMMHNAYTLAPPQEAFKFVHPNPENETKAGADNSRYGKYTFESKTASMMHGFVGYFESVLYKEFKLSINPLTHSPGMFSWFPIYFPIQTPFYVAAGSTVEIQLWRKNNKHKVWYEWAVTKPAVSPIHNQGGSQYFIGL